MANNYTEGLIKVGIISASLNMIVMKPKALVTKLRVQEKSLPKGEVLDEALRATIKEYEGNPIVAEGITGNPNSPSEYMSDLYARKWGELRGLRPHKKDGKYNEEVNIGRELFPEAAGFLTEGLQADDNPLGPAIGNGFFVYTVAEMVRYAFSLQQSENTQTTLTGVAALWGLFQGGRNAWRKHSKRKKAMAKARWLSKLFSRLYKTEEPLVASLKRLEEQLPAGEALDNVMKAEIEGRRGNTIVGSSISDSAYPVKHVAALYAKKWEEPLLFFPRFFSNLRPHRRDAAYNQEVKALRKVFMQTDGFLTEGFFVSDNPSGTAVKYPLVVYAIGTAAKYALPLFGVQVDEKIIDDVKTELAQYASFLGLYIGGRRAYRKWRKRQETENEASYLSKISSRLFN